MKAAGLKVQLVSATLFYPPNDVPWVPDVRDEAGCSMIEFAGRACYESWNKPNPATATNSGYIAHLLEVQHLSVLEHACVGFYITGVSRSLTHELIRHRHFSYSQLSQRYVPDRNAAMVLPPDIEGDEELERWFEANADGALGTYRLMLARLQKKFAHIADTTLRRKLARQAARAVLPNATETKIVVTGNYRAWRHFLHMRATEHADVEIRALAIAILRELWDHAPAVFCDFEIVQLDDGTEVALSRQPSEE